MNIYLFYLLVSSNAKIIFFIALICFIVFLKNLFVVTDLYMSATSNKSSLILNASRILFLYKNRDNKRNLYFYCARRPCREKRLNIVFSRGKNPLG